MKFNEQGLDIRLVGFYQKNNNLKRKQGFIIRNMDADYHLIIKPYGESGITMDKGAKLILDNCIGVEVSWSPNNQPVTLPMYIEPIGQPGDEYPDELNDMTFKKEHGIKDNSNT